MNISCQENFYLYVEVDETGILTGMVYHKCLKFTQYMQKSHPSFYSVIR